MAVFGKHTILGKLTAAKAGGTALGKLLRTAVGSVPVVGETASKLFGNGASVPLPTMPAPAPAIPIAFEPVLVPASQSNTPMGAPSLALSEQNSKVGEILREIGKGALGGAKTSATDIFLNTQAGKDAKKAGALSFVKDNLIAFAIGAVALGVLLVLAIRNK
jgi:hypothetical protein